jgi:uncharacterized protein (DUF488 family)
MTATASERRRQLFTIGHSNHDMAKFLALLSQHQVEVVVDVRSRPYSKYASQFNQEALREAVSAAGCKYLFLGRELGGRPDGAEFYDAEGHARYDLVAQAAFFMDGIVRLEKGLEQYRIALMCSEEDPACCHRHLLIGRVLEQRGHRLDHIRGDGQLQRSDELNLQERGCENQLTLFGDDEEKPWRSLKPVRGV